MANYIVREIYLLENEPVRPIDYVYGATAIGIKLDVKDFDISGYTATVASRLQYSNETHENKTGTNDNTAQATISEGAIMIVPKGALFEPGINYLQVTLTKNGSKAITFRIPVQCDEDVKEGGNTVSVLEANSLRTEIAGYKTDAVSAKDAAETAQGLAEAAQTAAEQAMSSKQDKLTAGDNITISNDNVISTHAPYDDTAVRGLVANVNRKANALVKLNEGISYEWETDETEAYIKRVPSGATLATVDYVADSVESITVIGKNLVTLEPGYIGDDGADKTTSNSAVRSGYFFVDTTKHYVGTVSHKCRVFIAYYDSQKNYIKRSGTKNLDPNCTTVTELRIIANPATAATNAIPSNAVYARITAYYNSDVPGQVRPLETDGFWVQVEEGNTTTNYSPYAKESISVGGPFSVEPNGRIIFNQTNDATLDVASTVSYAINKSAQIRGYIEQAIATNKVQEARISNLEAFAQGKLYTETSDTDAETVKSAPVNSAPYACVDYIGGMSRKCKNILQMPSNGSYSKNGVTATINSNGTISLSGTATGNIYGYISENSLFGNADSGFNIQKGNYYIASDFQSDYDIRIRVRDKTSENYLRSSDGSFVVEDGHDVSTVIYIPKDAICDGVSITIMLNEGAVAVPYEPYSSNLIDAKVDSVVSKGRNLIKVESETETINGVTFTNNGNGTVSVKGTATKQADFYLKKDKEQGSGFIFGAGNSIYFSGCPEGAYDSGCRLVAYLDNSYGEYININMVDSGSGITLNDTAISRGANSLRPLIRVDSGKTVDSVFSPMLVIGTTEQGFSKYFMVEKEIPEAIQSLDGYGIGINSTLYNYIDFERKVFVKRVGSVDLGYLSWSISDGIFINNITGKKSGLYNVLSSGYATCTESTLTNDKTICGGSSNSNIFVRDSAYTDVETFKTAMSGIMLYYELAEPVETDISAYLADDFQYIPVESGGAVTMHYPVIDTYAVDVPNSITYQTKVVS